MICGREDGRRTCLGNFFENKKKKPAKPRETLEANLTKSITPSTHLWKKCEVKRARARLLNRTFPTGLKSCSIKSLSKNI